MLEEGCTYHIYNRANGHEDLFRESRNYSFFLDKFHHHVSAVAEVYAYCLMANHFHAMVHIRTKDEIAANLKLNDGGFENLNNGGFQNPHRLVSKQFSNCFNSYAKAYNKTYKRNGSLFQQNMKAKKIDSDEYFTRLILYIHNNPVKHGFVNDPWDWPYSSIHQFVNKSSKSFERLDDCSEKLLKASKQKVINWFGNIDAFEQAHAGIKEARSVFD